MRSIRRLEDRDEIEGWLRRDAPVHLYELGDLDDFFWPHTTWFGSDNGDGTLASIALLYTATELPVVMLLARDDAEERANARALLRGIVPLLPRCFYAHLAPGLAEDVFRSRGRIEPHGPHERMVLARRAGIDETVTSAAVPLGPLDVDEILRFYTNAYPGNWFDRRMLETGAYFGVRDENAAGGRLVSVAGVHALSRPHRVAALGNIATDPSRRGQGLAQIATAAVVKALGPSVETIGLNVHSANAVAIRVYARLGFERVTSYEEALVTLDPSTIPAGPGKHLA